MKTSVRCALAIGAMVLAAIPRAGADDREAEELFVRRVEPLLTEKCLGCHGQDKTEGGLDLRSRESAAKGGESGQAAIHEARPAESPLLLAVQRTHDDWSAMPPKEAEKLTATQIGWIAKWLEGGAPWPSEVRRAEIARARADQWGAEDGAAVATSAGLSTEWSHRKYKRDSLWGYQPVLKPNPPQPRDRSANRNPIDLLISDRMPAGLDSAPPADARTLIRRATFDLTGLPPTPEEVAAFEHEFATDTDAAVITLVDRLLASPHYGERMAQHWLDVTRYADSSGFANDYERGNAWRYRDYVVRSFNSDKPYDQFIREQIAGDEIDPNDPEKLIATGFLRMGPWELTGMEVERIARQRFLDDVVNSVGETFLAHSLQCARCHDHKFDPVPTRDYYAIQAVFATTQLCERAAPFLPTENTSGFEERAYLEKTFSQHLETLTKLDGVLLGNAQRWFRESGKDPGPWNAAVDEARKQQAARKPGNVKGRPGADLFAATRKILTDRGVAEMEFPPKLVGFTPEQFGLERVARKGLERLRWELDRYEPFALAVYSGHTREYRSVNAPLRMPGNRTAQGELEQTCILIGGDPFSSGPKVAPGVLSILGSPTTPLPDGVDGRRRAFADWVASADNPLVTRAIANRIWMWHFGQPIAGNPNNFGSTGKKPTHPELLDWLAATFVEQGWSFKAMHRQIMTSAAYRSSGVHPDHLSLRKGDPLGVSYAVFKPRRLTAEELRDAMLSVSGELNPEVGGIPNRPEINLEAALQPRQVMGTFAAAWTPNPRPGERNRRSLYALKLRGLSDPAMEVFNTPSPDFSCERREASTVTPQVFALFNSRASLARSMAFAARVLKETRSDEDAIRRCFLLAYGRTATAAELSACLEHWRAMGVLQRNVTFVPTSPPLEIRRDAVEENTGEKFSFSETLHANADYVPDLQPADCDPRTRALGDVCLALLNSNEFAYVD